jgi:hypothetical protein
MKQYLITTGLGLAIAGAVLLSASVAPPTPAVGNVDWIDGTAAAVAAGYLRTKSANPQLQETPGLDRRVQLVRDRPRHAGESSPKK